MEMKRLKMLLAEMYAERAAAQASGNIPLSDTITDIIAGLMDIQAQLTDGLVPPPMENFAIRKKLRNQTAA